MQKANVMVFLVEAYRVSAGERPDITSFLDCHLKRFEANPHSLREKLDLKTICYSVIRENETCKFASLGFPDEVVCQVIAALATISTPGCVGLIANAVRCLSGTEMMSMEAFRIIGTTMQTVEFALLKPV